MALTRVSSFVIVAIALGCGYAKASESEFGVNISGPDVVHAGVSTEEARSHAEELISEGERLLASIVDYDPPVLRSLRGPSKPHMSGPPYRPRRPDRPAGSSIAIAENVWGDAIADSEAARGGTAVANSRTYSGTSIARARSNRRLSMLNETAVMPVDIGAHIAQQTRLPGYGYKTRLPGYGYPSDPHTANVKFNASSVVADRATILNSPYPPSPPGSYEPPVARVPWNRVLMMGPSKGRYYGGGGQNPSQMGYARRNKGNRWRASAENTWGDAIADSEASGGGTSIENASTFADTAWAGPRDARPPWRQL